MLIPDEPTPTPFALAVALTTAGWARLDKTDWTRPGAHPDRHSWPVAELILAHGWPHIDPPPAVPHDKSVLHPWRNIAHRPRRGRPVADSETVDAVRHAREVEGLSFPVIADRIGVSKSQAHYLYRRHVQKSHPRDKKKPTTV